MAERTAASIRARVRAEMIEEIKAIARRHLASDGANLSLRAVARDLGVVSSALYRYFASRDELLTALIIDAYNDLGEAVEAADATITDRADLLGRWLAIGRAIRTWALANPHLYALIYGSPVPGYTAPQDTIGPAARPTVVLGTILADAQRSDDGARVITDKNDQMSPAVVSEMAQVADMLSPGVPPDVVARALIAWTEIFGAVNFELFGRLNKVIDEREAWFEHQLRAMADFIGISARVVVRRTR